MDRPHAGLTVQQLESFVAVAEEGQFTRAADALSVAQPSVSFQVRRMEEVVGTRLFHRGHGPVSLTDAGVGLLPLARRVIADLAEIMVRVGDLEGLRSGHVSIGATPSLGAALLPGALARFHRKFPGISLEVTERDSDHLEAGLEDGSIDVALAILPLHHPALAHITLAVEELVLAVSHDDALATRSDVRIAELVGVPLIMFHEGYDLRKMTLDAFEHSGAVPTISLDGAEIGSVLSMVSEGMGAAIVPSIVTARSTEVAAVRIRRPTLTREIGLLMHKDRTLSLASSALCDEIAGHLAEHDFPSSAKRNARAAAR